jgi:hypothetical protein
MSRHNQILFLFLITLQSLCAQIPQGFDYQATVRDGVGNTITNTYVGFKFHILQGGAGVSSSYSEFHYLPTDDLGTVHLTIGTGDVETGTFDQIDWSLGNYHLSVEVNTGSGFVAMGTTQLMSVPFAMYALSSGDGSGGTNLPQGTNDGDLLQWDSTTNRWTVSSSSWHAFLPEVSTINATNTTALSSIVKGEIYSDGGATITSKGVVWSENPDPTVALATKTDEGGGAAPYTSSLTNLLSSKTYYYRAYATNSKGTGYGTTYVLYTMNGVASLSTGSVYNIGAFHATSEVSISEDGGAAITSKGLCWSTSPNPTLENSFKEEGSGTGSFTSTMTGLLLDTTYYIRSWATNSVGTTYGSQETFTTRDGVASLSTGSIHNIGAFRATSAVTISDDGGAAITSKGLCWSTSPNPTLEDSFTQDGLGTGSFTSTMTGLSLATTYYVRSYASNAVGTYYGAPQTFTTRDGVASLSTGSVYNIGAFRAMSAVTISDDGGATITSRGLCWSTSPNPTLEDSFTEDGSRTGSFTSTMTGLSLATTYYVRSYAINAVGTYYGNEVQYVNGMVYAPFEGIWSLAPIAGAVGVGPELGDLSWWGNSEEHVTTRTCIFDDTFFFGNDGSFANNMGEATWLEAWQGVEEEACGTPVYPQDGSDTSYTYSYDEGAQTITVYGVGAHIGVSKVYNNGEFAAPAEINSVESITYEITEMSEDGNTMTLDISIGVGYWRFILVRQE